MEEIPLGQYSCKKCFYKIDVQSVALTITTITMAMTAVLMSIYATSTKERRVNDRSLRRIRCSVLRSFMHLQQRRDVSTIEVFVGSGVHFNVHLCNLNKGETCQQSKPSYDQVFIFMFIHAPQTKERRVDDRSLRRIRCSFLCSFMHLKQRRDVSTIEACVGSNVNFSKEWKVIDTKYSIAATNERKSKLISLATVLYTRLVSILNGQ